MRPRGVYREVLVAGLVAAALAAGTILLYLLVNSRQPVPTPASAGLLAGTVALTVAGCAPIAVRVRLPRLAVLAATGLVLVGVGLELRSFGPAIGLVVSVYTVAAARPFPVAGPVLAVGAAAHAVGGLMLASLGGDTEGVATFWGTAGRDANAVVVATLGSYGVPAIAGAVVRGRGLRTAELLARAERLETERELRDRAAAADERSRIARELHDIAAHDLSAIVVQAGAADRLVDADPVRAKQVLQDIRGQGRETLAALRQLVGVLRDAGEPGDRHAGARRQQPGLGRLDDLIAVARATGMRVDVAIDGVREPLTAQADLAAFRVVQEALTNARRHAPGSPVSLRVSHERGVAVEVSNECPDPAPPGAAAGHGLAGMRERVGQAGGTMSAGPTPDGRWLVAVRLPAATAGER